MLAQDNNPELKPPPPPPPLQFPPFLLTLLLLNSTLLLRFGGSYQFLYGWFLFPKSALTSSGLISGLIGVGAEMVVVLELELLVVAAIMVDERLVVVTGNGDICCWWC